MRALIFIFCSAALVLFSACRENESRQVRADKDDAPIAHHPVEAVTFREGKGLQVPDDIGKLLGVRVVDVVETNLAAEVTVSVEVFRANAERILASGYVSKDVSKKLEVGQEITLESKNPESHIRGKLENIEKNGTTPNGMAEVVVAFGSSDLNAKIGTAFEGTILIGRPEPVVAVPAEALLQTVEGDFVYVVNGKHFFRTQVKPGGKHNGLIEIEDGLYAGDQVVLQPTMKLWLAELQAIRGGKACADGD